VYERQLLWGSWCVIRIYCCGVVGVLLGYTVVG
jgi:hypothetical protein